MKKEHPILMSTPMVQSTISGIKTMTRRIMKPQPDHLQYHVYKGKIIYEGEQRMWCYKDMIFENLIDFPNGKDLTRLALQCSYGKVEDILWVRETWQKECEEIQIAGGDWSNAYLNATGNYVYKADNIGLPKDSVAFGKWKPSIFMPRKACRIFLKITNIRVERLQDISESDAKAEGAPCLVTDGDCESFWESSDGSFVGGFYKVWEKINGSDSWNANPWVWVIEFERI